MPIIEVVQRIEVPEFPDIELPYEDGEPLESHWHRLQINLLGDALHQHWQARTDFFAGGKRLVLTSEETVEAERARTEAERGRAEAEHARAEALEAENARLRAELERLRNPTL